ncbi:hypothetical protein [Methylobrevis pamukkalensis]|uniref:Uncharacterized protein n=1 Tax=Methylobrevis pamukkalensis TaxID=1439726 RepID=A0A1E3H2X6_9HYPH|nr:hypothetical protein [Methylobrevis pamukkalensis]ODN70679.1 hypothetical protein A6302_01964 [Methylobrevis pamukkalensis]
MGRYADAACRRDLPVVVEVLVDELRGRTVFHADLVTAIGVCLGPRRVPIPDGLLRSLLGIRAWIGRMEPKKIEIGLFAEREQDVVPLSAEMLITDIDVGVATLPGRAREMIEGMLVMALRRYAVIASGDFLPIVPARWNERAPDRAPDRAAEGRGHWLSSRAAGA